MIVKSHAISQCRSCFLSPNLPRRSLSGAATSAFSTMSEAAAPLTFLDSSNKEAADLRGWPKRIPFLSYPVASGERFGAMAMYSISSIKWGALRSYDLSFPTTWKLLLLVQILFLWLLLLFLVSVFFVANIIVVVDSYHCHVWCLVESVETLDGYDYKVTKHDV